MPNRQHGDQAERLFRLSSLGSKVVADGQSPREARPRAPSVVNPEGRPGMQCQASKGDSNTRMGHLRERATSLASVEPSTKVTWAPGLMASASSSASQLVSLTHPCELCLRMRLGSGDPWMIFAGIGLHYAVSLSENTVAEE
jgi:hypothetical protein